MKSYVTLVCFLTSPKVRSTSFFSTTVSRSIMAKRSASSSSTASKKPRQDTEEFVPWYYCFTKGDEDYNRYMATEWSFEKRGDQALLEKICLEGAQSGLSWQTILRKREAYRRTFFNFDPEKVANMTPQDVQKILDTTGGEPTDTIVRHRGKIEATINNAKCLLQMQKEEGADNALDRFLWSFVDNKPILNRWGSNFNARDPGAIRACPSKSPESEAMSKALKKKGWKFVGPTTCYAMMQSCGMVIDHPINSPEWEAARHRLLQRKGGFQDPNGKSK